MTQSLPLLVKVLDAYRAASSAERYAIAVAGDHEYRRATAGLCHQVSQSLGQTAGAIAAGIRLWHGWVVNFGLGVLVAAGIGVALNQIAAPGVLTVALAIAAGIAAGYFALKYYVRWRLRQGIKALNACHIPARLEPGADIGTMTTATRRALIPAKNLLAQHRDIAKAWTDWHPFRMTRIEDKLFAAWLAVGRVEHACTGEDAFYKWLPIEPAPGQDREVGLRILRAREDMWPALDDLRRRGCDRELAIAYAEAMNAWEILGHAIEDLGVQLPLLGIRRFIGHLLTMLPGVAAATAAAVLLWPVTPAAVACAAAMTAMIAADQAAFALRRRLRSRSELEVRLRGLQNLTYSELDELKRTWAEALESCGEALEAIANDLIGDPNGTFDDEEFDAAIDQLPKWQRHTVANLGLAADRLDNARKQVTAWNL